MRRGGGLVKTLLFHAIVYSSSAAEVQEGGRDQGGEGEKLVVLIPRGLGFCTDGTNSLVEKEERGRASQTEHSTRQALESFGTVSFCYLGLCAKWDFCFIC